MSDTKNNGGPAFPTSPDEFGSTDASVHGGMTLRDYFAAKAMAGMLSSQWIDFANLRQISDRAYFWADAMLKAREE
jgi:hypothetical protein